MGQSGAGKIEQADGPSRRAGSYKSLLKQVKRRRERRKAKRNPSDCVPTYNKYRGYQL